MAIKVPIDLIKYKEFKINFKSAVKRTTKDFCYRSSIHGLKYVCDRDSNNIIRTFWFIIIIVMFGCGIAMIVTSYFEFRSNLTRLNIVEENAPIKELMFPAVTVCPAISVDPSKWEVLLKTLKLPRNVDINSAKDKIMIIQSFVLGSIVYNETNANIMENILELNNLTLIQLIEKVRWNCTDFLVRCRFDTKIVDCMELFQLSKTAIGYCCSFNLIQSGLSFTNKRAITPHQRGLVLAVKMLRNVSMQDFEIMLGPNNAFPNEFLDLSYLSNNEISFLSITPSKQYVSSRVRRLGIEDRKCVLKNEIKLRFFENYLDSHCLYDCLTTNILKDCGCLLYTFSSKYHTDRICSFKDLKCLYKIKQASVYDRDSCNCLPDCDFIGYDTSWNTAPMLGNKSHVDSFYDGLPPKPSVVHIFFASEIYTKLSHDLISDMLTLVSNLGSSFSLFVGISMVSVIEIFYYYTIVLWKNYLLEVKANRRIFFRKVNK